MQIRKGDTVVVITGKAKDHGKRGRVLAVYPKTNRILVEGINVVRRHTRPTTRNQSGGIVEKEAPVHISNVMPWCESANKPSKIRMKTLQDGSRVRVYKRTGETLKDNK